MSELQYMICLFLLDHLKQNEATPRGNGGAKLGAGQDVTLFGVLSAE